MRFVEDKAANFIVGATYDQEDVPNDLRGLPDEAITGYCQGRCVARGAAGFFFQEHTNGHEIVGFYATREAMHGQRVRHPHARGFLSYHEKSLGIPEITATTDVDTSANFLDSAPYDQEDVPADATNLALPCTLAWCALRARARGAAGFFYQEHANGHEIVGFYATKEAMAQGVRGWHGHARGLVVTLSTPPQQATMVLEGDEAANRPPLLVEDTACCTPSLPTMLDTSAASAEGGEGAADEGTEETEDEGWVLVDARTAA